MENQTIGQSNGNIIYEEIKLGYRGVKDNPIIPVAKTIESEEDLKKLTYDLNPKDEVKGVFAKNPFTGEIKAYLFPGHRELSYPHHSDIYFKMLDEWEICPIDRSKKSNIPYTAPLFHEIVWQRGLTAEVPSTKKPVYSSALGFQGKYDSQGRLTFQMGSYITLCQVDDCAKIDSDLFHNGVEWIKKIARNCNADFVVSEVQEDLEKRLIE